MNTLTLLILIAIAVVLAPTSPFFAMLVIVAAVLAVIFTSSDSKPSGSGGGGGGGSSVTVQAPTYPDKIRIQPNWNGPKGGEEIIGKNVGGFITFVGGLIFKIGKLLSQRDHKKEEKKD